MHSLSLKTTYTRLKDTQTKLLQAEKLIVLGELSANLAHEIKNPLVSIGGFASRLKKKIEPDSPLLFYVDYILTEVARLEELMDGILGYTMDKGVIFSTEDVNSIVEEALSFFSEAFHNHKIEVIKGFTPEPLSVMSDRQQLKIAFDNLFANAIQSMEGGGILTVQTLRTEDWVVVDVTDNGGGIDPRLIGNIFNPFFTTKKYGTGLGLDITHKIISKHKGHIDVENHVGQGVTFSVKLPGAMIINRMEMVMKKRVLVVDDEEGIRLLYKEELEEEGCEVEIAASGEEAIEKLESDSIDLVLLDIKMPGMDGIEVLRKVKERWKNLPVVLCTAYPHFKNDFGTWASDAYVVKSSKHGQEHP
jgi:CheY-like chemotaxis protein